MELVGKLEWDEKAYLEAARKALRLGDRNEAKRLAKHALDLKPNWEAPWLLMAAASEPEEGLTYVSRALELNPASVTARKAIRWLVKQVPPKERREAVQELKIPDNLKVEITPLAALTQRRLFSGRLMLPVLLLAVGMILWIGNQPADAQQPQAAIAALPKATWTPTPTSTPTFTPTPTMTSTPTVTSTPTDTPTPTITPTPRPSISFEYIMDPQEMADVERWIDVDVKNQIVTAYEGAKPVKSFVVSTGTIYHPTVVGLFRIWTKLKWDDMAGPGYYLPDVPYTMYFYKGYALHGTYWHSNFGTPMSHGCVNLRTEDAAWLFEFASIGTLVNVHPVPFTDSYPTDFPFQ
jgi:lipoprotein-anchoring transpeptidase ErfK/SrfK